MSRVYILVEGQTEESFVNNVLFEYLINRQIFVTPILLTTKRVKARATQEGTSPEYRFKGGVTSYAKVKRDVRNLLNDQNAVAITTMIDLYGLPDDFPGIDKMPVGNGFAVAQHLEQAFFADIGTPRFRPFLTLHEFEALLFSNTAEIAAAFPEQNVGDTLAAIRSAFVSPEEINQGRETHPAARIMAHVTGYRKPFHGALVAKRIGLDRMRRECSHFHEWVSWLESLGK